ncbi:MAG: sulfide/dihydroorotate dehydrogenase-like FAD/NAD-binding protein [Planctomycetes bacterium]|nr:sulfide/dihydroorotate dehydrogenase-like FAD/NAD-binding protein [Planctomycetota bacterium]
MHNVVSRDEIAPSVVRMVVEAPAVASKRLPGQFVVVRPLEVSERIPLTIVDSEPASGTITLIVQVVGATTRELTSIQPGENILDVVGPLGRPTHIEKFGRVVSIGGGVGTAVAFPIAKGMKEAGNEVWGVIGGRSRDFVILEDEMRSLCDRLVVTTDDGSYGVKGFVTDALRRLIEETSGAIDLVLAVGPLPMMKAVSALTREHGIHTVVSLNPIMVDGTGMCGGCRVEVGGEIKFACVDGPEFDAHLVDFDNLAKRLRAYHDMEQQADHQCKIGLATRNKQ